MAVPLWIGSGQLLGVKKSNWSRIWSGEQLESQDLGPEGNKTEAEGQPGIHNELEVTCPTFTRTKIHLTSNDSSFCTLFFPLETGSYVSQAGFEPLILLCFRHVPPHPDLCSTSEWRPGHYACWPSALPSEPPLFPSKLVSCPLVIREWTQHSTGQYHQANEGETKISTVIWTMAVKPALLCFRAAQSYQKKTKKQVDLQLK